jgi:hypothetical protein
MDDDWLSSIYQSSFVSTNVCSEVPCHVTLTNIHKDSGILNAGNLQATKVSKQYVSLWKSFTSFNLCRRAFGRI